MIAKAQLQTYENLEFSITITAKVMDWRTLLKQLEQARILSWPGSTFNHCIRETLNQLDRTHQVSIKKIEDQVS